MDLKGLANQAKKLFGMKVPEERDVRSRVVGRRKIPIPKTHGVKQGRRTKFQAAWQLLRARRIKRGLPVSGPVRQVLRRRLKGLVSK